MAATKGGNIALHNAKAGSGPGRPKGSSNKITRDIKEALSRAFEKVGGEEYLVKVAMEDPRTFCALLGKLMPVQMTGEDGKAIQVSVVERRLVRPGD